MSVWAEGYESYLFNVINLLDTVWRNNVAGERLFKLQWVISKHSLRQTALSFLRMIGFAITHLQLVKDRMRGTHTHGIEAAGQLADCWLISVAKNRSTWPLAENEGRHHHRGAFYKASVSDNTTREPRDWEPDKRTLCLRDKLIRVYRQIKVIIKFNSSFLKNHTLSGENRKHTKKNLHSHNSRRVAIGQDGLGDTGTGMPSQ